jgi:hypothetical protein
MSTRVFFLIFSQLLFLFHMCFCYCLRSLYILDMHPLLDIYFENICYSKCCLLFSLLCRAFVVIPLPTFAFVIYALGFLPKNVHAHYNALKNYPMVSSGIFIVSCPIFKSLNHFSWFLYIVIETVYFHLACKHPIFPAIFIE